MKSGTKSVMVIFHVSLHFISTNNVSPGRSNYDQLAHNLPQIKVYVKS